MTYYTKGADYERELKKRCEEQGYYVVRSAGSHGVADLVALSRCSVILIQCKSGKTGPKKEDFEKLENTAQAIGALAYMCWKTKHEEIVYVLDKLLGWQKGELL